ncbi:MAG: TlpA family protein disulfide reductase [Planctomycetota bacterium]|nr:TlpA family protein disulfide reductase [Planctomycetota bacterium]
MKAVVALLFVASLGAACAGALDIGDPAPQLQVAEFVKGEKADLAAGKDKHVYVVEFWATWCPPCRESIPHLSVVQKRFKDRGLVVVGISGEAPADVKPFVERAGASMNYTVAIDDANKTMQSYMLPFKQSGIPHAFVIDKGGRIAWHGHPGGSLEWAVKMALDGKLDAETSRNMMQVEELIPQYFKLAMSGEDDRKARMLGNKIVENAASNPDLLSEFSLTILLEKNLVTRDTKLALRASKAAFEATAGKELMPQVAYARALFEAGETAEAIAHQKECLKLCVTDEQTAMVSQDLKEFEGKAK